VPTPARRADPVARPTRVVNIADLPPHRAAAGAARPTIAAGGAASRTGGGAFRLVSATEPVEATPSSTSSAEFTPAAHYGYETSYQWLRGRLEFSQIDQRWKLRYVPVDGETDDYGGSVVLTDEAKLAGCERGDFVEVRGRVATGAGSSTGFSPLYEISELKRIAPGGR